MTTFDTRPGETMPETTGDHADVSTAGWYADPYAVHRMRYHSGADWTDHVTHFGPTPCHGCNS